MTELRFWGAPPPLPVWGFIYTAKAGATIDDPQAVERRSDPRLASHAVLRLRVISDRTNVLPCRAGRRGRFSDRDSVTGSRCPWRESKQSRDGKSYSYAGDPGVPKSSYRQHTLAMVAAGASSNPSDGLRGQLVAELGAADDSLGHLSSKSGEVSWWPMY